MVDLLGFIRPVYKRYNIAQCLKANLYQNSEIVYI